MKVSDLRRILAHTTIKDDDDVVIPIKVPHGSVGPTPTAPVRSVSPGFDWNQGKFMIFPENDLHAVDDEFASLKKRQHELSECLGYLYLSLTSRALNDKQKLNAVRRTLRANGFQNMEDEPE